MINLFNTEIEKLSIHKVGNKSRNEGVFISKEPYNLSADIIPLIKEFFFKPFREKEDNYYNFYNDVDLEYNDVFDISSKIFSNPDEIQEHSEDIVRHLYEQSNHPHIKSGEVYVAYLRNVYVDNEVVDAIGIFKSEMKSDFIQFEKQESNLEMILQQGISLNKLDKGCLILNTKKEEGYKVLSVDSNKYDSRYWLEHFLSVLEFEDENFITKKYMKFCQNFAKDVIFPAEDKKEEIMFMNRSMNYFTKTDDFDEADFLKEVLEDEELIPQFKNYKIDKGEKYSIEDVATFPIANQVVLDSKKSIKNVINLDTNIQIKMDFQNPESAEKFLEKGWDEEKQMYYYLVYFNKES
jgi:hypothetical protein